MINHVNNFSTNVTTDQLAGVTTSPVDAIPAIDPPYYVAFDATNANGHYEVREITSDTATHMNHAATTYAHSTDEAVRCILPATEMDTWSQYLGEGRTVQLQVFDPLVNTATGDGKMYFVVPAGLNGYNLSAVHAKVITAGTTNTTDIQIHNLTQTADMLTTKITIDSGETGSDTAAAAAVIDTANDDVATYDVIRIDVDAISTTPAKGLFITLTFTTP